MSYVGIGRRLVAAVVNGIVLVVIFYLIAALTGTDHGERLLAHWRTGFPGLLAGPCLLRAPRRHGGRYPGQAAPRPAAWSKRTARDRPPGVAHPQRDAHRELPAVHLYRRHDRYRGFREEAAPGRQGHGHGRRPRRHGRHARSWMRQTGRSRHNPIDIGDEMEHSG